MSKPRPQQQDELGGLKWLLLAGALLYLLFSLLTWPFRLAVKHLPGRRDKLLRARAAQMRDEIPSAQQLVRVLGAGAPDLEAKMEKKMRKLEDELDHLIATQAWAEDITGDDPWLTAMEILEEARRVAGIDHNASVDELKKELAPLLRRCSVSFDWAFVREFERTKNWDSLKNENLLPIVASRLAASGHVLAQIDAGSDNYDFALCTPNEFSSIQPLSSGGYAIRKFESLEDARGK